MILAGNNTFTRIKFGNYQANHGIVLLGNGYNNFMYLPQNKAGFNIKGNVRSTVTINTKNNRYILFGTNNDTLQVYKYKKKGN